jgi:glycosyltransferase involved in cell wall biosynthesis
MLYPQALSQNYWKKWPLLKLWFNKDIHQASCIHVTCEREMKYMRNFGYKGAIALISNTFNKPDYTEKLFREHIKRETSCNKRNQLVKIGFIGRLDPIKNVENILYGVSLLKGQSLEVYIIGTGDVIYEKFLRKEAKRLNLTNRVHFVGFLDGYKKYEMLSQMDAIFVPSKSENFGMIVPESLLVGTPVMASLETPWNSLNTEQCGWWTDNSPETISKIINEIRSMTSEDKIDLSKRCRDYIVNNFNSKVIASQMMQLYNWLNNTGEKPEFVYD